jgi:flagellar protein FlaG
MIQDVAGRNTPFISIGRATPAGTNRVETPTTGHAPTEKSPVSPVPGGVDRKDLEYAVAKVQETFKNVDSRLKIEIDPDLHRVVVKILNGDSGEIIRQIPAEEMLEIAKRLEQVQGILFTKRT